MDAAAAVCAVDAATAASLWTSLPPSAPDAAAVAFTVDVTAAACTVDAAAAVCTVDAAAAVCAVDAATAAFTVDVTAACTAGCAAAGALLAPGRPPENMLARLGLESSSTITSPNGVWQRVLVLAAFWVRFAAGETPVVV